MNESTMQPHATTENVTVSMPTLTTSTTPEITGFTTAGILQASAVAVLIIVAVVGNIVVILSFAMFRSLRSLTNYYIVSLSISDLLIACFLMPVWFGVQLHQPRKWPPLGTDVHLLRLWMNADLFLCMASILSLTAISVERNLAITNPLYYTKWISLNRVLVSIVCLWLCALLVAAISWTNPFGQRSKASVFVVIASYFLPTLILFIMYGRILIVARRQARRLRQDGALAADFKAIRTIAIVVGAFQMCYTPYMFIIIWYHFKISRVPFYAVSIARWLTYFNSCLNPIIYSCFNKTYREAFKRLFQLLGKKLQGCRRKMGAKQEPSSRTMQRSRLSLNMTLRSSAGSLLDGTKVSTNIVPDECQSHSTRFSQVSMNSIEHHGQKAVSKFSGSQENIDDQVNNRETETNH